MKDDLMEDMKDAQEIKKQKEERRRTKEEMATWEFGKGVYYSYMIFSLKKPV